MLEARGVNRVGVLHATPAPDDSASGAVVATLAELAAVRTDLDEPSIDHLLRLIASWSLLADLAFSDMLLMAKVRRGWTTTTRASWCSARCVRTIAPRSINDDLVGTTHRVDNWLLVREAFRRGTRVVGELGHRARRTISCRCGACPCDSRAQVIAVLVRLQGPLRGTASLFEQSYLSVFVRLCDMVVRCDVSLPRGRRRRSWAAARG